MAAVVRLFRGYYVPQFVLGGLTRAVGQVIWRYTATTVANAVMEHTRGLSMSLLEPYSQSSTPLKHEISLPIPTCILYLPIQAICPLELIPLSQTLESVLASPTISSTPASTPASSDLPHSMTIPQIIGSYLLSPPVMFQLAILFVVFIFVTSMHRSRSERVPSNNVDNVGRDPLPPTRVRKLQRKPSDSSNWRTPRNNSFQTEPTETSPHTSITSPTIADPTGFMPRVKPQSPQHPQSFTRPPNMQPIFDFGTRRPFADVGNANQAAVADQTNHKHRRHLSSQQPLKTPVLPSEPLFHKLHHRASFSGFPVDATKDSQTRRHARSNSNNGKPDSAK
ncbi:hypothetical protein B0H13DRAFT_2054925 [Mycena leptocephala]|nr:hypothetical protein B0H13DRAFT_2054925 [Mycena leptocephala]